jgi:hypothetical protein
MDTATTTAPDPEDRARAEAARLRREAATRAAIAVGLQDLEAWISDQLASGLPSLLNDLAGRSRRIAARMTDAKAPGLASRIDEMASRVLSHPPDLRIDALTAELGQLVLLARAWGRGDQAEPGLARTIATSETRDTLLANVEAPRIRSVWRVVATEERTRRDGLVSQATWCLNFGEGPRFALLLDFFPATAGKRQPAFGPGAMLSGELAFYPSRMPLRAQIAEAADVPITPCPFPPPILWRPISKPCMRSPGLSYGRCISPAGALAGDRIKGFGEPTGIGFFPFTTRRCRRSCSAWICPPPRPSGTASRSSS